MAKGPRRPVPVMTPVQMSAMLRDLMMRVRALESVVGVGRGSGPPIPVRSATGLDSVAVHAAAESVLDGAIEEVTERECDAEG